MAAFDLATVPAINAGTDGVTLDLLANGVVVDEDTTHSATTVGEFRIDAISIDDDGNVVVTEGEETDDATEASAEAPDYPEGNAVIGLATVSDSNVTSLDLDLGGGNTVSADESHVA